MNSFIFVAFLALLGWLTVRPFIKAAQGDDLSILPRVEEEFRALIIVNDSPELNFDGRSAEIVDEHLEGITDSESQTFTLHRVHRFARNAYGEYFFFISEGTGRPFFKHVNHVNARIALGNKYIPPAQAQESGN